MTNQRPDDGEIDAVTLDHLADAHHLASTALTWLDASREYFRLPRSGHRDPNNDFKPLGELALAASLVMRENTGGQRESRLAPTLIEFAWEELDRGTLLYEQQLRHPLLTDLMEIYAPFARAGYRHAPLEELLAHLTALRATAVPEMMPNRRLAVLNAARVIGLPLSADMEQVAERTWLGGTPEPWMIDWSTAYAVTHTVFHLTDWAARPKGLPKRLQEYLRAWLPVWLEIWLEAAQWDLVAELLLVDVCLEQPGYHPHAWRKLREAQHDNGMLPYGPHPTPERPEDAFTANYHPTCVAAIAGTLAVSRGIGELARHAPAVT